MDLDLFPDRSSDTEEDDDDGVDEWWWASSEATKATIILALRGFFLCIIFVDEYNHLLEMYLYIL